MNDQTEPRTWAAGDVAADMESEGRGCSRGRAFFLGGDTRATVVRANMRNQIVVAVMPLPMRACNFFLGFGFRVENRLSAQKRKNGGERTAWSVCFVQRKEHAGHAGTGCQASCGAVRQQ